MDHGDFVTLMETIRESWIAGDTPRALECFTDDCVYMEPPDEQRYEGRAELFEFFGGDDPPPMDLAWHHLVVDGDVGVGEYTFRGARQYHGIVIVQLRDGRVGRWREYQVASDLDYDASWDRAGSTSRVSLERGGRSARAGRAFDRAGARAGRARRGRPWSSR